MTPLIAITCPHCGAVLAETDGQRLYVGRAYVVRRVVLHCAGRQLGSRTVSCSGYKAWTPEERPAVEARVLTIPA